MASRSQINTDTAPLLRSQSNQVDQGQPTEADRRGYTGFDSFRPKSVGPGRRLPTIPSAPSVAAEKITSSGGFVEKNVSLARAPGDGGGYGPFFLEYSLMAE